MCQLVINENHQKVASIAQVALLVKHKMFHNSPIICFKSDKKEDAPRLFNELKLTGNTKVITIFMHSIGQPAGSESD